MQTKSAARNIFYGESLFFLVVFIGLTVNSHIYVKNTFTNATILSESVIRGKRIWERKACINCHTILGEGAKEAIKAWMQSQHSGIKGRRQMPNFRLTDPELDDLANFLEWVSTIDTQGKNTMHGSMGHIRKR